LNYSRYFRTGQKATLRITVEKPESEQSFDTLYAVVASCAQSMLEISFPSPFSHHSDYPFTEDQKIEIHSDHQGMGVSIHANYVKHCSGNRVQIKLSGDLEYFNQRRHRRFELRLWLGLEKGAGSISSMRKQWEQKVEHFRENTASSDNTGFTRQDVSISSSGLGLHEISPVKIGDCYIILLALDDDQPTICILGEVVRCDAFVKGKFSIGIHFDCIEENDRKRIAKYAIDQGQRED